MQKITTFLWFDDQAEEAANFYVSAFSSRRGADSDPGPSKVVELTRYGEAGPGALGTVMTASFQLAGQEFTALNGGKQPFSFNESVSLVDLDATELLALGHRKRQRGGRHDSLDQWTPDPDGAHDRARGDELDVGLAIARFGARVDTRSVDQLNGAVLVEPIGEQLLQRSVP